MKKHAGMWLIGETLFITYFLVSQAKSGVFPHYSIDDGDQDATIEFGAQTGQIEVGDVNGDQRPDLLFNITSMLYVPSTTWIVFGTGNRLPKLSNAINISDVQIINDPKSMLVGSQDINNDGIMDLIYYKGNRITNNLHVVWGRTNWNARMDLQGVHDLTITGAGTVFGISKVNVNGDEYPDFFLSNDYQILVLLGRGDYPPSIDVSDSFYFIKFSNPNPNRAFFIKDANNDGLDDFWIGLSTGIRVVYNMSSMDYTSEILTSTSSLFIQFPQSRPLNVIKPVSDLEGKTVNFMVYFKANPSIIEIDTIDPNVLMGSTGSVRLSDLSTANFSLPGNDVDYIPDFDGDGKTDYWTNNWVFPYEQKIFLGADINNVETISDASISIHPNNESLGSVLCFFRHFDFDGDGKSDFLFSLDDSETGFDHAYVFYGFHPLTNPLIQGIQNKNDPKRVLLSLDVNGSPTEMKLDGDLDNSWKGRWIPFSHSQWANLTGTPGRKQVSVVFRSGEGRDSAPAEVFFDYSPDHPVTPVTNRLRGGEGLIEVDCPVQWGDLRARVFERGGRPVRTLFDGPASGATTVRWDGRTEAGERAVPGVYILVLEMNGGIETTEILLEP